MKYLTAANVGRLVLLIAVAVVAVQVDRAVTSRTSTVTKTDTVRVDTAEPDTSADAATPTTVTLYDTVRVTETRTDTVRVPTDFDLQGCIQGTPIRRESNVFGEDELTLSYFNPDAQRWEQQSYEAGRSTWALWPAVEIRTTPWGLQASGELGLRWRDWTLSGGYVFARKHRGWTVGVSWRPFQLTP